MTRIAEGNAATIDLDSGVTEGATGKLLVDKSLLDQMQIIREGEFDEKVGAPTLKLVGDLLPIDPAAVASTQIVYANLTSLDVLNTFLSETTVPHPVQYILYSAHSSRAWLPIWHYIRMAGLTPDAGIDLLRRERATRPTARDSTIERLKGERSAFRKASGKPKQLLDQILANSTIDLVNGKLDGVYALALQGLPDNFVPPSSIKSELRACLARAEGGTERDKSRLSAIFRAACRVDELLNASKVKPT